MYRYTAILLIALLSGCRQDGVRPGSQPLTDPPGSYPQGAAPAGGEARTAPGTPATGGTPASPASQGNADRPQVIWDRLGQWSGKNSIQTESFTGLTGGLRVTWEVKGPADGTFQLTIHSSISGRPLQVAVDQKGPGADVAYVNEDPRVFFAVVETDRMEWSFTIDEAMGTRVVKEAPAR